MTSWLVLLALLAIAAAVCASLHAIGYKREVRAAIAWTGFIWILPLLGPLFYLMFGVNRIRRHGASMRGRKSSAAASDCDWLPNGPLKDLARFGDRVSRHPLRVGCRVVLYKGGASVYPAMLRAIDTAQKSIALCTYILTDDKIGHRFIDALGRAAARGVQVRVLVDAAGTLVGRRHMLQLLVGHGIDARAFLPAVGLRGLLSTNLRNHRKLLIADGTRAFTGGVNLADEYAASFEQPGAIRDTHFELEGPAVAELQQTFAEDWEFVAGEHLSGQDWFPPLAAAGEDVARVVADGPDEDFERIRWIILGAIAAARSAVRIVTPYFLPDGALISALNVAALRGVRVEIVIPERLDHQSVKWASNALLWQVLERGCRVWFTPPPFDHSKLFTVDGAWAMFGSANWDPRSLRLNFEANVEVFSPRLAGEIDAGIDRRVAKGREITLAMMDSRPFPIRIRDGVARLFTPYL